jgi:hypothetical protein
MMPWLEVGEEGSRSSAMHFVLLVTLAVTHWLLSDRQLSLARLAPTPEAPHKNSCLRSPGEAEEMGIGEGWVPIS